MIKHVALGAALALATVATTSTVASAQTTISNAAGRTVQIFYTPGSFDAPYQTTASSFQSFDTVGQRFGDGIVTTNAAYAHLPASLFPTYLEISKPNNAPSTPDGVASFAVNDARLFSFVIGSIHSSNNVQLTFQDNTTLLLEGLALVGNLSGQNTSGRVTYDFGSALNNALTRIDFIATLPGNGNAFQVAAFTAAAPEPATWAMMIFGFGAAGTALRRRQRVRVRFA